MYKTSVDGATKDAIRKGDTRLLLKKLRESDVSVIKDLKSQQDPNRVAFLQGASHILDRLINLLEVSE